MCHPCPGKAEFLPLPVTLHCDDKVDWLYILTIFNSLLCLHFHGAPGITCWPQFHSPASSPPALPCTPCGRFPMELSTEGQLQFARYSRPYRVCGQGPSYPILPSPCRVSHSGLGWQYRRMGVAELSTLSTITIHSSQVAMADTNWASQNQRPFEFLFCCCCFFPLLLR